MSNLCHRITGTGDIRDIYVTFPWKFPLQGSKGNNFLSAGINMNMTDTTRYTYDVTGERLLGKK